MKIRNTVPKTMRENKTKQQKKQRGNGPEHKGSEILFNTVHTSVIILSRLHIPIMKHYRRRITVPQNSQSTQFLMADKNTSLSTATGMTLTLSFL